MKRKFIILLLPFLLNACNGLGSKKVKNIVELTPKLTVQSGELVQTPSEAFFFDPNMLRNKAYTVLKNKIATEPVFVKGVVYVMDINGSVYAFSKKDQKILWTYNVSINKNENHIGGGILYHNEQLFVTYGTRSVVILNSSSGHEILRKEFPDIIRIKPVKLDEHTILVQTVSNQIFALNASNLNPIWQHETLAGTLTSSRYISPIVHQDLVLVNYNSGQIVALSSKTGQALWVFDLSNKQDIGLPNFEESTVLCMPIVADNSVYIATGAGKLFKLDITGGQIIWETNASDIISMSLFGNSLFITNNAQQVAAISTASGQVKFVADLYSAKDFRKVKASGFLAPLVSKVDSNWSLNIIATNGMLYSFPFDTKGNIVSTPVVTKIGTNIEYYGKTCCGTMYFITDKKIIFADKTK